MKKFVLAAVLCAATIVLAGCGNSSNQGQDQNAAPAAQMQPADQTAQPTVPAMQPADQTAQPTAPAPAEQPAMPAPAEQPAMPAPAAQPAMPASGTSA
ncbi:MAG: hypothetical protein A2103_04540 [Gammaproteobacteria bacterium GWF2_41_13]|nr:MAG: hypothetical protein A2103_04540 [Gammaproteobacteria bacterium GWF2_41_13]